MATALPIVATRVGANADLMQNGQCGLLVPREDVAAMADALLSLASAPAAARVLGMAGRAIVEQRFSLEAMVGGYERLYRRVLIGTGDARPAAMAAAPNRPTGG
jgi:glycosyltransferase involved in cell wall biosynthesis